MTSPRPFLSRRVISGQPDFRYASWATARTTASAGSGSFCNVRPYSLSAAAPSASGSLTCTDTPNDCNSRTMSKTCEFRKSTTFSLNVSPSTVTRGAGAPAFKEAAQALARYAHPDGIVDAPTGKNHVGMIARFLRSIGEVIGIDPDAVATDQARGEVEKIPLGPGRCKHIACRS